MGFTREKLLRDILITIKKIFQLQTLSAKIYIHINLCMSVYRHKRLHTCMYLHALQKLYLHLFSKKKILYKGKFI